MALPSLETYLRTLGDLIEEYSSDESEELATGHIHQLASFFAETPKRRSVLRGVLSRFVVVRQHTIAKMGCVNIMHRYQTLSGIELAVWMTQTLQAASVNYESPHLPKYNEQWNVPAMESRAACVAACEAHVESLGCTILYEMKD